MNKYYKCVAEVSNGIDQDRYFSINYFNIGLDKPKDEFIIEYKLGEWVEPKIPGSGLLVFSNRHTAFNFGGMVFEVEVEGYISLPKFRLSLASLGKYDLATKQQLENVWSDNYKSFNDNENLHSWPYFTEAFRRVKLIKKANYYKD